MTAQDLKNSIFQLVLQGKLVPQNPDDEPASELLKRIEAEKAKLIREGKIRREKPLLPISEDEIPFDIPESWEWVRWGTIAESIQYGYNAPAKSSGRIKMVRISDIQNNSVNWESVPYCDIDEENIGLYLLRSNDILFARTGGTVGKSFLVSDVPEEAIYAGYLIRTRYSRSLSPKFLKFFMESQLYWNQLRNGTIATAQPNCNGKTLGKMILPLPPIAEQKRIVAKIEELLPFIERYDESEKRLLELNKKFPDELRKSILQQAVQGKLTEQDPHDEPASELLKRIKAEKEILISKERARKEKPYKTVKGEDLPFEIPNSWKAVRIGEVGIYKKGPFGSSLTKSMFIPKGNSSIKVYEQKNAIQKDFKLGEYYIKSEYFQSKMKTFEVHPGDVIVSCAGTIGETYILPEGIEKGIINQALMRMKIVESLNIDYFLLYFDYVLKIDAQSKSKGSAIRNIPPFEVFKNMILPIPPIEEQARIVDRVKELLPMCDSLI